MPIPTGSDSRGLWRLQSVHRLVGLSKRSGCLAILSLRRSDWTKTLAEDQHLALKFHDQLRAAAAVSTGEVE
jgi:hypothetical protein